MPESDAHEGAIDRAAEQRVVSRGLLFFVGAVVLLLASAGFMWLWTHAAEYFGVLP